jgi:hypothetical protein
MLRVPSGTVYDGERSAAHGVFDRLHDVPHDGRLAAGDV